MSKYSDLRQPTGSDGRYLTEATQTEVAPVRVAELSEVRPVNLLRRVAAVVGRWSANRAARRDLAALDRRSLREIGISPELADYEVQRRFWHPVRDLRD